MSESQSIEDDAASAAGKLLPPVRDKIKRKRRDRRNKCLIRMLS
jgi:hypothetical protein